MGKYLKTYTVKDKRGNSYRIETYQVFNGVLYSIYDSFDKVVDTGKFRTKKTVILHAKEFLNG